MRATPRLITSLAVWLAACSPAPEGLRRTPPGSGPRVKFDVYHRPLPDIPLPNDFATRFDASSATRRRLNASMIAPTRFERRTREELDQLDGWGTIAPISVAFDHALDTENTIARHLGD